MRPSLVRKQDEVKVVSDKMKSSAATIVVNYSGLTVSEITDLRIKLREQNGEMRVYKNNIARRAAADIDQVELSKVFEGPTAVVTSEEDAISTLKILDNFRKDNQNLELISGVIDGEFSDKAQLEVLAKLPSKQDMYAMLAAMLQSPIRDFALAVKEVANKKEEEN
jgi:large subunit ribosomal protein L10